jgi:hypothetical protein
VKAINALKAWALAEVVMTAVYAGQWRGLRFENPAGPLPASALVAGMELAYLLPFLAAVLFTLRWWQGERPALDPVSSWAMLTYSLASIASFALWDRAVTLADARQLLAFDAGVSLLGLWPALSLIAFIRRTAARP